MTDIDHYVAAETKELTEKLINKYIPTASIAREYYLRHVRAVCQKAFNIAKNLNFKDIDPDQLYLGCMLHDIGIVQTHAPDIGCYGEYPYLCHAWLGRKILEDEGLHEIAPVCENHVGVGITAQEIKDKKLPLPIKDIGPQTLIEKIVCLADKFFSKSKGQLETELPLDEILKKLNKNGKDKTERFMELIKELRADDQLMK